jgi:PAS domain S-box-containing protein
MKRKYLGHFNYFFIIATFLLLAACTHEGQRKEVPRAINGLLDLTRWNFNTDGPVKLAGEWEFYWETILKAEEDIAEPRPKGMTLIKVPGMWNGHKVNGKKISGSGYATYRLKVLVSEQKSPMAFKFLSMGTAFDLYVNGKEVTSAGKVGTAIETMTPEWLPHIVDYTPESNQMDLRLHISNFNHRKGGAIEVIQFGAEKDIREMSRKSLALDLFLCGSLFIMGFYHLVLFLLRRENKEPLYLSIFCLFIAAYALLSGERYFAQIFPGTSWEFRVRLTNFTSFMSTPVFLYFIHSLFSQEFKRTILHVLSITLTFLACFVLLSPARVYSHLIPVFHIITLISAIYTIYVLVLAFTRKRDGSLILLMGTCAIILAMINDVLYDNSIIKTGQFIPLGIFAFTFSQSILLSSRFSKTFTTIESQTKELTRTNHALEQEIQRREKMEETMKVSEEKYRLLAENATDVIWTYSLESMCFTYVSPSIFFTRGYTPQEALSLTLEQSLAPESFEQAQKILQEELINDTREGVALKRSKTLEVQQPCKDGTYLWTEVTVSFIRNAEGQPVSILGVTRNINDRKRAEEKFRLITENMTDCVALVDTKGTYQYVSPSHKELLGYDPEDMIGISGFDIAHPDDLERITRLYLEGLEQGWRETSFETNIRHKDGHYVPMEIRVREVKDPQRKLMGGILTARDVTKQLQFDMERKRSRAALQESEQNYRLLATYHKQLNDISIAFTEASGTEDLFNKIAESLRFLTGAIAATFSVYNKETRALKIVSLSTDPISSSKADSIFGPDLFEMLMPISADRMELMLSQGIGRPKDLRELSFGIIPQEISDAVMETVGCRQIVALAISYAEELFGTCAVYLPADQPVVPDDALKTYINLSGLAITRKQAEEEKQRLEDRLKHAEKMEALGNLAGGISHDFNNLLMGIQGYTSLILNGLDPSHRHYMRLKLIEEQVQSGANLTRQLLGVARGGKYDVKPTDMNELLEKSSSMFGRTKKEITIYRKYGKALWNVEVDRGQMEQVFMNLYVNAWQAMQNSGAISIETENVLLNNAQTIPYSITPGQYVKISVTDTGTGMDEKTKERIFDPFFTTKEMGKGTGLGLATVYGIIIGHKGMIHVDSEPGHGTTFNIYLPASERDVVKEKTKPATILRGKETILLVDDETMVTEVNKELLESMGYRVYAVGSGQEALAVYMEKKNEIDLVILDMIMPGISGGETFNRLHEINSNVKVLLSSGYSINGQAQEILDRGCNGFIQKPFRLEELSIKVRELLD